MVKILIFYIKLYPEDLIFKIQCGNFQVVREGERFKIFHGIFLINA